MSEHVDKNGEWAALIGRLFIAFGVIEKVTHECMRLWLKDPIYTNLKSTPLSKRIDLVSRLVPEQGFKQDLVAEFEQALKQSKDLAEYRNLVAHNPLMLVLFEDCGDFREAITHVHKEEKYIELDELQLIVKQAENIENKLMGLLVLSKFDGQELPALTKKGSCTH